jgi:hypothetical protein
MYIPDKASTPDAAQNWIDWSPEPEVGAGLSSYNQHATFIQAFFSR